MVGRLAGDLRLARDSRVTWPSLGRKGQASILYTAEKQPAVFFATSARLLPSDVRVTVEQSLPGNLSMEDWQMMKEVIAAVQAIPDAANAPPGAVLRECKHVETAVVQFK